ncbi:MAG: UDP-N-acetylmuramate dehydrogenase [Eggerthella sp.]|nr:UDP-N-acetylmuramate dehydrogenase [Eggerthella sp.]
MARHASDLELLRFEESFDGEIRLDEPLSKHTSYRIGGPARAYILVNSPAALSAALAACKVDECPWVVVGKGSNLLVSDAGFKGAVIVLAGEFRNWKFDEENARVVVGAGTTLSRLVQEVFHRGYSGMEFAVGTPGSVGGAVRMNAGTKDDWIGSRVVSVTTFAPDQGLKRYAPSDIEWAYRSTSFALDEIIVEVELQLTPALSGNIHDRMRTLLERRKASQPLEYPSCGSVFKNPEGASAGALIDEVGLKGSMCGGAQISEKHANFIVNKNKACASDVLALIKRAQEKVKEHYGIELQPEVKFLGFEEEFKS